jgi:hypothetical protein
MTFNVQMRTIQRGHHHYVQIRGPFEWVTIPIRYRSLVAAQRAIRTARH